MPSHQLLGTFASSGIKMHVILLQTTTSTVFQTSIFIEYSCGTKSEPSCDMFHLVASKIGFDSFIGFEIRAEPILMKLVKLVMFVLSCLFQSVIASGLGKLSSVPTGAVGGGAPSAGGGGPANSAATEEKKEEPKKEEPEEESDDDMGFGLFD